MCAVHPCCLLMDVCFVLFLFFLSACVCICLQVRPEWIYPQGFNFESKVEGEIRISGCMTTNKKQNKTKSKVPLGPGASGLPCSYTPLVCVPALYGEQAVWWHNNDAGAPLQCGLWTLTLAPLCSTDNLRHCKLTPAGPPSHARTGRHTAGLSWRGPIRWSIPIYSKPQ